MHARPRMHFKAHNIIISTHVDGTTEALDKAERSIETEVSMTAHTTQIIVFFADVQSCATCQWFSAPNKFEVPGYQVQPLDVLSH